MKRDNYYTYSNHCPFPVLLGKLWLNTIKIGIMFLPTYLSPEHPVRTPELHHLHDIYEKNYGNISLISYDSLLVHCTLYRLKNCNRKKDSKKDSF